jgi:uncharacterized protein (TIGR02594 family)
MIPMANNTFLYGIVEDVMDPVQLGRVRVRWIGIHSDDKTVLPTNLLPWCQPLGTINSAFISGVGLAPVGMVPGTMVLGLPADDGMQEFIILGTMGGNRAMFGNSSSGFNDPNGNYPRAGVAGDINVKAGGNGDTGSSFNVSNSVVQSTIPGSTDPEVPPKTLDPNAYKDTPWMPVAQSQLGINELDNADTIRTYHQVGGGLMREPTVAWCAAFVGWCLSQVSITGTRSASSRSYLNYGKSVGTTNVPFGAIAVFGVPNSGSGHVAFVSQDNGSTLTCIGGNQSDKSHRSGGMVSKSNIPKNGSSLVLLDCVFPTNLQGK